MRQSIEQHEGKKYLREIASALPAGAEPNIHIDVYAVITAFGVDCPATAHAIKKLLCAGKRAKGNRCEDLVGAMSALNRAIDMEQRYMSTNGAGLHNQIMSKGFRVQFREGDQIPNEGSVFAINIMGNAVKVKANKFHADQKQMEVEFAEARGISLAGNGPEINKEAFLRP